MKASPRRAASPTAAPIDQFYDWIYRRGVARLAARGITPQQLYQQLREEERS